jgi:hypothetical protein
LAIGRWSKRDSGDVSSALDYAEHLTRIVPADQNGQLKDAG